ncbi:MAG: putative peptidoglycan glycosyltransferase FtsW [Candidatus Gribaldobacteria bacterium]|nr:putative peptidoglycan glycosyltransferase FtsW [Candidatus Gribaldobacteria bacterium]
MVKKVIKKKSLPDYFLLIIAAVLTLWGLFAVGMISLPLSQQHFGNPWNYLQNQIIRLAIGLACGLVLYKLPLKTFKKFAPLAFISALVLSLLVFAPILGVKIAGGQRWINIGGGFLVQPSEFLKIAFIVYLAAWLGKSQAVSNKKKTREILLPFLAIAIVVFAILIIQHDLSTLCILMIVSLAMYFISSTPLWHTLSIAGAGAIGLTIFTLLEPYRIRRWLVFLNPESDPLNHGFQLRQSMMAVGSGKLWGIGEGFGMGLNNPQVGLLPAPLTDSIFAIIGKGWGFLGATLFITLIVLFFWRVLKIAKKLGATFEGLTVFGIGVWLMFQSFFNIGGMLGLLPMGGVPLPFFSYGGSHIIAEMMAMGILLNFSKKIQN